MAFPVAPAPKPTLPGPRKAAPSAQEKALQVQIQKQREFEDAVSNQEKLGRTGASLVGQTIGGPVRAGLQTTVMPALEKLGIKNPNVPYMPKSDVATFLFGEEPIYSLPKIMEDARAKTAQGDIKGGAGLAGMAVLGTLADLTPGGGGKKKAAQEGAEAASRLVKSHGDEALSALGKIASKVKGEGAAILKKAEQELSKAKALVPEHLFPNQAADDVAEATVKNLEPLPKTSTAKTQIQSGSPKLETNVPSPSTKPSVSAEKPVGSYSEGLAQNEKLYNTKNIDLSEQGKKSLDEGINAAKPKMQEVVGKPLTNKEVEKLANETGAVLKETVGREETAKRAAENLNLRRSVAEAAQSGNIGPEFVELWLRDKAAGADLARQLQARRITARPEDARRIDMILDGIYRTGAAADEVADAAKGVDWKNPESVATFYRTFVKPKASDWIDTLRYNSMLSSPLTHIQNAASNLQGTALISPIEKAVAGGLDAMRSALTGAPRKQFAGEGVAYTKGYFTALSKATRVFSETMSGKKLSMMPDVLDIPLKQNGVFSKIEKAAKLPLRLLEASDQFFSTLTESGIKSSLEYRIAKGANVGDIGAQASEEAARRLFRGELGKKEQGYVLDAIDTVANLVVRARDSQNPIVSNIAKFTLPFVRTPTNILKQGLEYSPMGLATLVGNKNKTEQMAKIIIGTSVASGVATMLGSNRLTWAQPTNEKEKQDFLAAGMQPYSVKIGDKWVSYSKLHPALAFNFALVSALDDSMKRGQTDEATADKILSAVAKWGNFFADQSYMKQIGDLVAGVKGDETSASKIVSNYASQLIPARAMLSWINNFIDPVQRQADPTGSMLDQQVQWVMTQLPGFSKMTPPKTDAMGNPINKQHPLWNAFSPFKISTGDEKKQERYEERATSNAQYADERKAQTKEGKEAQAKAKSKYNELSRMSPEDANVELEKIASSDKRLYDDLKAIHESVSKNYTIDEENLRSLNIENGFRAKHIWETTTRMKTPEEKNAYLQELEAKKIVTPMVAAQLFAHSILEKTNKMKTPEEKNAYLDKLIEEGKMSPVVEQTLRQLTGK
jgi:hypothetical protein